MKNLCDMIVNVTQIIAECIVVILLTSIIWAPFLALFIGCIRAR